MADSCLEPWGQFCMKLPGLHWVFCHLRPDRDRNFDSVWRKPDLDPEGTGPTDWARGLTNEVEEGEADEEVRGPVEAVTEGKGSPSDFRWVDLTEDQPGH